MRRLASPQRGDYDSGTVELAVAAAARREQTVLESLRAEAASPPPHLQPPSPPQAPSPQPPLPQQSNSTQLPLAQPHELQRQVQRQQPQQLNQLSQSIPQSIYMESTIHSPPPTVTPCGAPAAPVIPALPLGEASYTGGAMGGSVPCEGPSSVQMHNLSSAFGTACVPSLGFGAVGSVSGAVPDSVIVARSDPHKGFSPLVPMHSPSPAFGPTVLPSSGFDPFSSMFGPASTLDNPPAQPHPPGTPHPVALPGGIRADDQSFPMRAGCTFRIDDPALPPHSPSPPFQSTVPPPTSPLISLSMEYPQNV